MDVVGTMPVPGSGRYICKDHGAKQLVCGIYSIGFWELIVWCCRSHATYYFLAAGIPLRSDH